MTIIEPTSGNTGIGLALVGFQKVYPNVFIPQQFINLDYPQIHYLTTGAEIWNDLGQVDIFVSGLGSGGRLAGVGRLLAHRCCNISLIINKYIL